MFFCIKKSVLSIKNNKKKDSLGSISRVALHHCPMHKPHGKNWKNTRALARLALRSLWSPTPVFPSNSVARMDLHLTILHLMPQRLSIAKRSEHLFTNKLWQTGWKLGGQMHSNHSLENGGQGTTVFEMAHGSCLHGETFGHRISTVLSAHSALIPSEMKTRLCGSGALSGMQKSPAGSPGCHYSTTNTQQTPKLKAFFMYLKKIITYLMFIYVSLSLDLRMPWSFIFKPMCF